MPRRSRAVLIAAKLISLLMLAALLFGCANPLEFRELLDGPEGAALAVRPSSGALSANDTVVLAVSGGHPPYEFSLVSGSGTLNDAQYTAPAFDSTETIEVTDSVGNTTQATFTVDASGVSIGIFPAISSVYTGDSIGFSYVGGTGPYTYSFVTNSSGGSIDPSTGVYVAGPTPGTDTIRITDGFDSSTDTASVTVTERSLAISPVSITVTPGDTFDFNEIGGTGGFTWSLATDASGATINPSTGAYTAGAATGTDVVRVTDTYDGRTRDATVTVQAASFSTNVDYTLFGSPAVTSIGGDIRTGSSVTASATVENLGTAAGTQDITWSAYASTDTTVGGTDYLIDSGVITGGLAAGGTQAVSISGAWPAQAGSYYVLIAVAASDDLALANNVGDSGTTTAISKPLAIGPAAATIYVGQSIGFTGEGIGPFTYSITTNASGGTIDSATGAYTAGSVAGTDVIEIEDSDFSTTTASVTVDPLPTPPPADLNYYPVDSAPIGGTPIEGAMLAESFTIYNDGPDDGTEDVVWLAYLSSDATISSDDDLVDSGTVSGLAAATSSASITIDSGNWPAVTANTNYHLILEVKATDEPIGSTTDNTLAVSVVIQNSQVDYVPSSVASTGASIAGGALSGEFSLENTLADSGAADVSWNVYLSTDASLVISGSDTLVATGTHAALAGAPDSVTVPFGGTWRDSPGPYYIKVEVAAADDSVTANNIDVSSVVHTTAPDVDYVVPTITVAATAISGNAISADFTLENTGSADGGGFVSWSAYVSSDTTYDAADTLLDSGIATALASGGSNPIPIGGSWPPSAATYYLIVRVSAVDDIDGTNNETASSAVTVTTSGVIDYVVTDITVNNPTVFVGDRINETLTVKNIGDVDGNTATLNLEVSTFISSDQTLDAGDSLIMLNDETGLVAGDQRTLDVADLSTGETWPSAGTYYILAEAISTEELAGQHANAVRAAGPVVVRPRPDLEASFYSALPVSVNPGDPTGTRFFRISEVNGADAISTIEWKVVMSEDLIHDPSDYVIASGVIGPLAASDYKNRSFAGSWPTVGNQYNVLAVVSSPDDTNATNDVAAWWSQVNVTNQQISAAVADAEPNDDRGPTSIANPPPLQSTDISVHAGVLDAGLHFELSGALDSDLGYDTMEIEVGSAQAVEVWVEWASGSDDLDLYLWDTLDRQWTTFDTSADREPSSGRLIVGGWLPGDIIYIGIEPKVSVGSYTVHVVGE